MENFKMKILPSVLSSMSFIFLCFFLCSAIDNIFGTISPQSERKFAEVLCPSTVSNS